MKEIAKETVKEAVPEAVKETLRSLGVDTSNVNDVQKDFLFLRKIRTVMDSMWAKLITTAFVALGMYTIAQAFPIFNQ